MLLNRNRNSTAYTFSQN